jgi:hypothetical protein
MRFEASSELEEKQQTYAMFEFCSSGSAPVCEKTGPAVRSLPQEKSVNSVLNLEQGSGEMRSSKLPLEALKLD